MSKPSGGRLTFYAEEFASKWFPGCSTVYVHVVREATLSPDLSEVQDRRLRAIRVHAGTNATDRSGGEVVDLPREAAIYLRDALSRAISATEGEVAQ